MVIRITPYPNASILTSAHFSTHKTYNKGKKVQNLLKASEDIDYIHMCLIITMKTHNTIQIQEMWKVSPASFKRLKSELMRRLTTAYNGNIDFKFSPREKKKIILILHPYMSRGDCKQLIQLFKNSNRTLMRHILFELWNFDFRGEHRVAPSCAETCVVNQLFSVVSYLNCFM